MKKLLFAMILIFVTASVALGASFKDSLLELDDVVSVEEIVQSGDYKHFAEKYIVTFIQPLDWNGSTQETFTQRVEIGFNGYDNVNVMNVGGYALDDSYFTGDDCHEIAKMYNGNCIDVEYRYFNKSVPAGLDLNGTALWEYLTDENASNDFHHIMEQLKEILSGSWVFTGTSKGGQATNVFAYYFPNDADAYVSYVAPFCDGVDDGRVYEAIFNTIGDERYGKEQARAYRDLMLDFMVEAIRNRDYIQPILITSADLKEFPLLSADVIFESHLLGYVMELWQYDQNFASVDEVMKLADDKDLQNFADGVVKLLRGNNEDDGNSSSVSDIPYYVQASTENGNYGLRAGVLREALAKENLSLEMSEELEHEYYSSYFTEEQKNAFKFDPTMRNKILDWTNTNTSNVIMIYGDSDPWYFARLPKTDNPNIHIFTSSEAAHGVKILSMEEEYKTEITELLNNWLRENPSSISSPISSSSGGCNSLNFGFAFLLLIIAFNLRNLKGKR